MPAGLRDFLSSVFREFIGWIILIAVLVGIPVVVDFVKYVRANIDERKQAESYARAAEFYNDLGGPNGRLQKADGEVHPVNYRIFLAKGFHYYGRRLEVGRYYEPFLAAACPEEGLKFVAYGAHWDDRVSLRSSGLTYWLPKESEEADWRQYRREVYFEDARRPEAVFYRDQVQGDEAVLALLQDRDKIVCFSFRLQGACDAGREARIKQIVISFGSE